MNNKIERGQFFTKRNIFKLTPFKNWWNLIPEKYKDNILEPFAGSNNIINLLKEINLISKYKSFDIEPKEETVIQRDTFIDFPKGFNCVITNPPYLSKNSASKKKINIKFNNYNDLYEIALSKCLENSKYVAAIIPESFITTNKLKERVYAIISLTYNDMFDDTEHPVCLALFVPEKTKDYEIYKNEDYLGTISKIKDKKNDLLKRNTKLNIKVKFNMKDGKIHLLAVDNNTNDKGILFSIDNLVKKEEIKVSSRARTRIKIIVEDKEIIDKNILNLIQLKANEILKEYRKETADTLLTSFKGLRKDGYYRRRLDFDTAKKILIKSVELILN